jgi:hypothetical protein
MHRSHCLRNTCRARARLRGGVSQRGTVALVDRCERETGEARSSGSVSTFAGFRFLPEVISVAVRWYLRYGLSYRDVEELLAECAVTVDHVTIFRWSALHPGVHRGSQAMPSRSSPTATGSASP